uniref:Uncharacterized protein n=1 Tax=Meloidogyne incognita TaxID=6306 RepID=A0A914M8L9_MELIC
MLDVQLIDVLPKCILRNCNNTLRALLRGKTSCMLECTVTQWCQMKTTLIVVEEPSSAGTGEKLNIAKFY